MQPAQGIVDAQGNKQGEWKTYDAAGRLRVIENYLDNELHGIRKVYYDNDTLRIQENYHYGVQVGLSLMYHSNGNLNEKKLYDSTGMPHGPFEIYYENGKRAQKGVFNKGRVE
jgi:antitoxin component YwqK of YwqJK toxin-antitoxin module